MQYLCFCALMSQLSRNDSYAITLLFHFSVLSILLFYYFQMMLFALRQL